MALRAVLGGAARLTLTRAAPVAPRYPATLRTTRASIQLTLSGRRFLASDTKADGSESPVSAASTDEREAKSSKPEGERQSGSDASTKSTSSANTSDSISKVKTIDWEDYKYTDVSTFKDLPSANFGWNQHMIINAELKAAFTQMLRQFNAPIMFCFAYGSGVFPQSSDNRSITEAEFRAVHPKPPEALMKTQKGQPKMIDFIFGVTHTEHWHWLNIKQHRDHYSGIASLGSGVVSSVQENFGAGVYFNPYVVVNGMLIKYGVTSISNLCRDLSTWETLYLAGRLHKPVKILRDNPSVRIANQQNLVAAVRTALLMLPEQFSELELFGVIAGISYLGDPRMSFPTENPSKVTNIVTNNLVNFRRLYAPLINKLPNVRYVGNDNTESLSWVESPGVHHLEQDMDPVKRGNMVRRLPSAFRSRLYFQYQTKFQMTRSEYNKLMEETADEDETGFKRRQGGEFESRIAQDDPDELRSIVRKVIKQTIHRPSTTQSLKGVITSGLARSTRYLTEKWKRHGEGKRAAEEAKGEAENEASPEKQVVEDEGTPSGPETAEVKPDTENETASPTATKDITEGDKKSP